MHRKIGNTSYSSNSNYCVSTCFLSSTQQQNCLYNLNKSQVNIKIAHLQLETQWKDLNKLLSSRNYLASQEFDNGTDGKTALLRQSCLSQLMLLLQQSISCHSSLIPHLRTALDISLSHNCNLLLTVTQINLTQVSTTAETYTPITAYLKYEFR